MINMNIDSKRVLWVDVAKFLAILAVMVDHTNGILYTNSNVATFSYFSTSLFVLIMGVTTFWSFYNQSKPILKNIIHKSLEILRVYFVATFIYYIVNFHSFDLEKYAHYILRFNIVGPLYYVSLYLQLLLVAPIIFKLFKVSENKKYRHAIEIGFLIVILIISSLTTNYTNILSVYGGGGKLLGGTYLLLMYIGMWFAKYLGKIQLGWWSSLLLSFVGIVSVFGWWRLICRYRNFIDSLVPFGGGFNPPSISFCVFAILISVSLFSIEWFGKQMNLKIINNIFTYMAYIGKHTLYIFLYHELFLNWMQQIRNSATIIFENIWSTRIIYFGFMIIGSMLLEIILESMHKFVKSAYK